MSVLLSSLYPGLVKIQFSLIIKWTFWLVKKVMLFTRFISIGLMWFFEESFVHILKKTAYFKLIKYCSYIYPLSSADLGDI